MIFTTALPPLEKAKMEEQKKSLIQHVGSTNLQTEKPKLTITTGPNTIPMALVPAPMIKVPIPVPPPWQPLLATGTTDIHPSALTLVTALVTKVPVWVSLPR